MARPRSAPRLLSDRRHHELLVKFSRIIVWSERELTTQEPWHVPTSDPALSHLGHSENADAAQTWHA